VKIAKNQLKQIILEEIQQALQERNVPGPESTASPKSATSLKELVKLAEINILGHAVQNLQMSLTSYYNLNISDTPVVFNSRFTPSYLLKTLKGLNRFNFYKDRPGPADVLWEKSIKDGIKNTTTDLNLRWKIANELAKFNSHAPKGIYRVFWPRKRNKVGSTNGLFFLRDRFKAASDYFFKEVGKTMKNPRAYPSRKPGPWAKK